LKIFLGNPGIKKIGWISAILIIASVVRLIGLNSFGYNSDEAVYSGQAAAIVQNPVLMDLFPIFRAHPLLFQFFLSLFYFFGISDLTGRLLSVAIGVATVYVTFTLGKELYGDVVGFVAALFLAVMPYHVLVTRQVLLDGPMTLFSTLSVLLLARYAKYWRSSDLYFAATAIGLTFLTKEIGILFIVAIYIFFSLSHEIRLRFRDILISAMIAFTLMALYPLSVMLAGGETSTTARQYLVWQLLRLPNHSADFYLRTLPLEFGPLVLLLAILGFFLLWKERSWREILLMVWLVVPILFFQFWPTKGFQYLLPIAPIVSILAARTIGRWFYSMRDHPIRLGGINVGTLAIAIIFISLLIPTLQVFTPATSSSFLAGSGGVPGGREAGEWIAGHLPDGSTIMTIGPSMANILQFYGHQRAYGLSVSDNPLYRNPSYRPIDNPDKQILMGEIQYIIWDAFSAQRSEFFSEKLLGYVQKYNGRVFHIESIPLTTGSGQTVDEPIIIVYRVYP